VITIDLIEKTATQLQKEAAQTYWYGMVTGAVWAQEKAAHESALAREWSNILHAKQAEAEYWETSWSGRKTAQERWLAWNE
jgi:hypothetical protein